MKLIRYYMGEDCTRGLLIDGDFIQHTIEEPWKDNQRNISCIPKGKYKVKSHCGNKFKQSYLIQDVPNRGAILFHAGNTTDDTMGCVLVGLTRGVYKGKKAVFHSRDAFSDLQGHAGMGFDLEIIEV